VTGADQLEDCEKAMAAAHVADQRISELHLAQPPEHARAQLA